MSPMHAGRSCTWPSDRPRGDEGIAMPRFEFRLQAVLAIRQQQRKDRRAELAAAFAAEREMGARRDAIQRELALERRPAPLAQRNLDVAQLQVAARYRRALTSELEAIGDRQ